MTMEKKQRILLFTGDGKGKTTAAFGLALRATGHGKKVIIIQFIKSDTQTGECKAISVIPNIELIQKGMGFIFDRESPAFVIHQRAAEEGLELTKKLFAEARHDVYVLDEVCNAIDLGLLKEKDVLDVIKGAPQNSIVVLTGRSAKKGLIELADTVTEMVSIKHGLESGIKAQEGVEW